MLNANLLAPGEAGGIIGPNGTTLQMPPPSTTGRPSKGGAGRNRTANPTIAKSGSGRGRGSKEFLI